MKERKNGNTDRDRYGFKSGFSLCNSGTGIVFSSDTYILYLSLLLSLLTHVRTYISSKTKDKYSFYQGRSVHLAR